MKNRMEERIRAVDDRHGTRGELARTGGQCSRAVLCDAMVHQTLPAATGFVVLRNDE